MKFKIGNGKNKNKKMNNSRYLDIQSNNIDSIIEKILQKNHGKKTEININKKSNNNNLKNYSFLSKINYPNIKNNKNKNSINQKGRNENFEISNKTNTESKTNKEIKNIKKQHRKNKNYVELKKESQNKQNITGTKVPINNFKELSKIINEMRKEKDKKNKNNDQKKLNNTNNFNNKEPSKENKILENDKHIEKNEPKIENNNNSNIINKKPEKIDKIKKRSLSSNNMGKGTKNKKKYINKDKDVITKIPLKDEKNKSPYLDIFKLNKINRLIKNSQYKNSVLYNKIIQPYNNTKTLLNNNISYKTPMIKYANNNIIQDNNIDQKDNIIKEKKEIFNLNEDDKNNGLKTSKSCYLNNRHNIDKIRYLTINQSANFGNCFACNLGCSVSKSGYSPMNYSPYNGMKRRDNLGIPTHILYQCVKKI